MYAILQFSQCTCFNNYDRSHLSDIDPDNNYINNNNVLPESEYFDELSFKSNFQKSNHFSIFLHNMRSLPDHFRELTCYLDTLDFDFKVLALTETWLKSHHTNYTIPNYNIELDNRENNRGGGVCLYIHTSAQYKLRNDLKLTQKFNSKHSKDKKSSHKEVNSIFVEIQKGSSMTKHNIIGCIYRPPCYPLAEFNELLSDMLNNVQRENKHIYITGDFNCNILLSNHCTEEFKNIFSSNHFFPLINKPSRITVNSKSLIDNIYLNDSNIISKIKAGLLNVNIGGILCK